MTVIYMCNDCGGRGEVQVMERVNLPSVNSFARWKFIAGWEMCARCRGAGRAKLECVGMDGEPRKVTEIDEALRNTAR